MKDFFRNQNLLAVVAVALFSVLANLWVTAFPVDGSQGASVILAQADVTSENFVPEYKILNKNILTRTYNTTTKKESLVGNHIITIYAPSDRSIKIAKKGFYTYVRNTSATSSYITHSPTTYSVNKPATVTDPGKGYPYYVLAKGKSATFGIKSTYNPLQMFAGGYQAYIGSMLLYNDNGVYSVNIPEGGNNTSNTVTVIGEKAPYITGSASKNNPDGSASDTAIFGVRFDATLKLYVNNVYVKTLTSLPTNIPDTRQVNFNLNDLKLPSTTRSVNIQLESGINGRSQVYFVEVRPESGVGIGDVTFESSSINLDYSGDNQSALTGTFKVNIAANDKDVWLLSNAFWATTRTVDGSRVADNINGSANSTSFSADLKSMQLKDGRLVYILPAGQSTKATFVRTVNPQNMYAGTYLMSLKEIYAVDEAGNQIVMQVPANKTDGLTVVGEKITPTASSSIAVNLVTTTTSVNTMDGSNDDFGTFEIKFKVTAIDGDVYIPSKVALVGANPASGRLSIRVEKAGTAVTSGVVATLTDLNAGDVTSNGNFLVEEGTTHTFTLTAGVQLPTAGTAGQYRVSIAGISWGPTDTNPVTKVYSSNLENFKTNYQALAQSSPFLKFLGNSILGWLGIWN